MMMASQLGFINTVAYNILSSLNLKIEMYLRFVFFLFFFFKEILSIQYPCLVLRLTVNKQA